jgi:hypothetical protein
MRARLVAAMFALLATGCSAGTPSGDGAPVGTAATPSGAATATALPSVEPDAPIPSLSASTAPGPADWTLVSDSLARPAAQVAFDAARDGQLVVASVLTEDSPEDYDAGVVYSQDGGRTWMWGGVLAAPGRTFPESIMLVSDGAVMVGSTQTGEAGSGDSSAFMARAVAPEFVPEAVALPEAFAGTSVHLQSIVSVDGEWVVAGYVIEDSGDPQAALWRSSDEGATWNRQDVRVKGTTGVAVKQLAIAPDGSWNLIGQSTQGDIVDQYDALWLTSSDHGRTFTRVSPAVFKGDFDQGAESISFSPDGKVAIVGWDEVTDEHGANVSALWISVPGHGVKRIGNPRVAVKGGTPPEEFLDGVVWKGETAVGWGSTTGEYPMDEVQFWVLKDAELSPTTALSAGDRPLAVARILTAPDGDLAFGLVGDLDVADVAVWSGTLDG